MNDIILYTTDCPKCKILESKLDAAGVSYTKSYDINFMIKQGFLESPVLEIDGQYYPFGEAVRWVNAKKAGVI